MLKLGQVLKMFKTSKHYYHYTQMKILLNHFYPYMRAKLYFLLRKINFVQCQSREKYFPVND